VQEWNKTTVVQSLFFYCRGINVDTGLSWKLIHFGLKKLNFVQYQIKMAPGERGRNHALCYGKCWSKLLLTERTFDLFFAQSCDIQSEFSYIICSYLRGLVVMYLSLHRYNCQLYASLLRRPIYRFQWELEANLLNGPTIYR
jgi:hypothetical protein